MPRKSAAIDFNLLSWFNVEQTPMAWFDATFATQLVPIAQVECTRYRLMTYGRGYKINTDPRDKT
jgi:hypothetical protein